MAVRITETPRDAMQGLSKFIPTQMKVDYINSLLKVGFDVIDFGSFVSPKAIPQLRDTGEVVKALDLSGTDTKLLAIVANMRGAETGSQYDEITYLGYPHSISNRFLELNIRSNIQDSRKTVAEMFNLCEKKEKELVIYLSMAFGNPYQESWDNDMLYNEVKLISETGIRHIALSDTIGIGNPESIGKAFETLVPEFPDISFSLHLHTTIDNWYDKLDAAYKHGCRGFDGVLNGLGGCPMADHELVGNIYTGFILEFLKNKNLEIHIDRAAFENAITKSITTFALIDLDIPDDYGMSNK